MLYGLESAAARAEIFDPTGLGAVVPHVANLRTTTGGGFGVAAVGGGAASGDTSGSPVAGSVGSTFHAVGRSTAIFKTTVGPRRFVANRYQPTAQGARVSPPWTLGLSGLGDLAAVVPHAANVRTSQHGGFGVASIGGGGSPGDSSGSPAAGTVGGTHTVGRNTAIFNSKGSGQQRKFAYNRFQPSSQGARAVPQWGAASVGLSGDAADLVPRDGLGLSGVFGWLGDRFTPPGGKISRVQPFGWAHRRRPAPPQPAPAALPPQHTGPGYGPLVVKAGGPSPVAAASSSTPDQGDGLSGIFSWITQRFVPPGGNITKIQIIPASIRNVIPSPIRQVVRLGGAAVQTVFLPILPGAMQRQTFGLSPSESGFFMKGQQVMRIVDAVLVTAGAGMYVSGSGLFAPALAVTPSQSAAMIAADWGASAPVTASVTAAQAAAVAAPTSIVSSAAVPIAAASPFAAPAAVTPVAPGLIAADFGTATFATPAQFAATLAPSQFAADYAAAAPGVPGAGSGFLSTVKDAGAFVGKTAVTTAAAVALQAAMAPKGGPQTPNGSPVPLGYQPPVQAAAGYAPTPIGGGYSSGAADASPTAAEAAVSPLLLAAGGGVGLYVLVKVLKRRQRGKK